MTKTKTKKRTAKTTKSLIVERLLKREGGATLEAMCEATGWQSHSCRAFLTCLRKKGREVVRYNNDKGESIYKMTPFEAAKAEA